jgi:predicted ArsR family transcriptional regulator
MLVKSPTTTPDDMRRHRALADPRRSRILDEVLRRPEGADVASLAELCGLHPNTVRWHLGVLADAGIVRSQAETRSTPGRPRVLWLATEPDGAGRENYRLLATILTGAAADAEDGAARAEAAGRAWGRFLVERPPPHVRTTDDESVGAVVELLDHEGFEPERADETIRMRRCPFRDLAETHGAIVCPIHRGLISGALAELGSSLEVSELQPFVEPNLCVARLQRAQGH